MPRNGDSRLVKYEANLIAGYFPAAIPIPIAKTPINSAMETPADTMPLINDTVVMMFLLPEGLSIRTQSW
jgi:hypothetical protein